MEEFVHQQLAGNGDFHILQVRKITQCLPTWQMLLAEHDLLFVTELKFPGFDPSLQGSSQGVGIVAWVFFLQQFEQGNWRQCWSRSELRDNDVIPYVFQRILAGSPMAMANRRTLSFFNASSGTNRDTGFGGCGRLGLAFSSMRHIEIDLFVVKRHNLSISWEIGRLAYKLAKVIDATEVRVIVA